MVVRMRRSIQSNAKLLATAAQTNRRSREGSSGKMIVGTLFPQITPAGMRAAISDRSLVCPAMSQKPTRGMVARLRLAEGTCARSIQN